MKRIAIIDNGAVSNVVAFTDGYTPADGQVDVTGLNVGPGDLYDGQNFSKPAAPAPVDKVLSKTAFQDYAVSQLGTGTTGMIRFQTIMDACEAGTGLLKFCFSRYEAALTFAKPQVSNFTQIMVANSVMTTDERTAIINNWPTE